MTRSPRFLSAVLLGVAALWPVALWPFAPHAFAEWPTDPTEALVVGPLELGFTDRIALAETVDGATWIAWQENFCGGVVRLQRVTPEGTLLVPGALDVQPDPTCGFALPPLIATIGSDVVVTRALASGTTFPVRRVDADGTFVWGAGYPLADDAAIEALLPMSNGDVLLASRRAATIVLDRVTPAGGSAWKAPAVLPTDSGANFRILGAVPDGAGGALLVWDTPLAYTRLIHALRVDGDGVPVWTERTTLVEPPPGVASSRHSTPALVADGAGGAIVVFARGFESGTTPAPLLMQRVRSDGTLAHPIAGVRVADGTRRQFDPVLRRDDATGDLLLTWRDGQFDETAVRAQRLDADGTRRWAPGGVLVAPLDNTFGSFDAIWRPDGPRVAITDETGADLRRLDPDDGAVDAPTALRVDGAPRSIRLAGSGDGVVVAWQEDLAGNDDVLLAQRVRPDGTLGAPPACAGDLDADGAVGGADLAVLLSAWGPCPSCAADLDGDGTVTAADLAIVLGAWGACR